MTRIFATIQRAAIAVGAGIALAGSPLAAQPVETVDPDATYGSGIDADLETPGDAPVYAQEGTAATGTPVAPTSSAAEYAGDAPEAYQWSDPASDQAAPAPATTAETAAVAVAPATTYKQDDLIGAAQGVFGDGAEGLAKMIENLLAEQGEPNAYIVGREAGGAFIVGARYGSGTLFHKVEGERPVYWTGPSIGFDAGANASNTFVLVYNLYDSEQLYERFPAGEGQAYVLGGLTASYLRKGDTVLIPIRVGAGLRLGLNAGYMRFSKKQRWLPF